MIGSSYLCDILIPIMPDPRLVFLHGGTIVPWKSFKQTLVATFTNHSKIIAPETTQRMRVVMLND